MKQKIFAAILAFSFLGINISYAQEAISTNKQYQKKALSSADALALVKSKIEALPSVRGIIVEDEKSNVISVIHSTTLVIRLESFVARLNARGADREYETKKFVDVIAKSIASSDPFKKPNLKILVRSTAALDEFELLTAVNGKNNTIVRKQIAPNLEATIVAETKSSIAFMPIGRLNDLKITKDEVFTLAQNNFANSISKAKWINTPQNLMIAKLDGVFDTSLMMVPSIWQSIEEQNRFPIALAIPNRGMLVFGRANNPKDIQNLKAIIEKESKNDFVISKDIYIWQKDHWILHK
jgi:hypothetical protein